MASNPQVELLLKQGQLVEATKALESQIRAKPSDANLRVVLFQLACLAGNWERAMTQLNLAADMDAQNLLLAQGMRAVLGCETFRRDVFAGKRAPLVFGEPAEWVGLMIQANDLSAKGHVRQSQEVRARAREAAPDVSGTLNGKAFEWVADADDRLGPVLEALVDGRYFWVPMQYVKQIELEPPSEPRDLVWAPAHFTWANGGSTIGYIPTRYPGSESSNDPALQLARKTEWVDKGEGLFTGLGQRMFFVGEDECPLLEMRNLVLDVETTGGVEAGGAEAVDPAAPQS